MKIILRIQGAKGSRIQVKGMEVKTLESSNPFFVLKDSLSVPNCLDRLSPSQYTPQK
jgi:hypothetical protein